jgi:hypothetical protein
MVATGRSEQRSAMKAKVISEEILLGEIRRRPLEDLVLPATNTRLRNPQIDGDLPDRLRTLKRKLDRALTELRRGALQASELLPERPQASQTRCPDNRGRSG